jgi:hypothetical protein
VTSRSRFAGLLSGLGLAALALPVFAETLIVPAAADNTLIESATGALSNGSGPAFFVGRNSQAVGSRRRGVIRFDVAAALPPGVIVTGAELRLVLTPSNPQPIEIGLHRVLADWGEGESAALGGSGAPAAPGDATWLHTFYDETFWANPGGDFVAEASATVEVGDAGEVSWPSTPETVADVQSWLDFPDENYGWLLLSGESSPTTAKRFASRKEADPAVRPQLVVEYEAPCATVALDHAAFALCEVYCETLDCDAESYLAAPRACAQLAGRFAHTTGGADLPCERLEADLETTEGFSDL